VERRFRVFTGALIVAINFVGSGTGFPLVFLSAVAFLIFVVTYPLW
jgi:hypothetical protein